MFGSLGSMPYLYNIKNNKNTITMKLYEQNQKFYLLDKKELEVTEATYKELVQHSGLTQDEFQSEFNGDPMELNSPNGEFEVFENYEAAVKVLRAVLLKQIINNN